MRSPKETDSSVSARRKAMVLKNATLPWSCVANAAVPTILFRPVVPLIHNSEAPVSSFCASKSFRVYFSPSYKEAALRNIARLTGSGVRERFRGGFGRVL